MAKEWGGTIPGHLKEFALSQKVFFIASAVADEDVNLSPKGLDCLRIVDEKTVAYSDYHGSGDITARHMSAGGKATITFISFGEKPLILRFYCKGRVVARGTEEFDRLSRDHFAGMQTEYFRRIFYFDIYRVQTSCGFGAPRLEYLGDRTETKCHRDLMGL
jgi:hypothetical protein